MADGRLRIGFQVWGQYVSWSELMAIGAEIDRLGFDELWSNDHFLPLAAGTDGADGGLVGPVFEGWSILFGWAGVTRRVRMGCLVSGAAYRNPVLLVKMATALDHATGGRAALGLGGGWFEPEHRAFGWEFPPLGQRIDRFAEAARICRGLLDGEAVRAKGRWFTVDRARNDPPPVQEALPLVIGGSGEKRTLRIVAENADIWNADGDSPESLARRSGILDEHCRTVGRDPAAIERTVGLPPLLIRDSRDDAVDALTEVLRPHATDADAARRAAAGSPFATTGHEVAAQLRRYRDAGASAVMFDLPAPYDQATLEALAGPVRAAVDRD
ncbi:MAG TPA: LLM class flavin-dependent oxidoreductase [Candidatus Limnocylindrales bacterium]|nr:LLM class flavin-dependent oxidoreductase [Candidatus Limnocylindrales bacterium]